MARLTVLIVDDEPLIRAGLRLVLDGAQGIVIVGEAGDGVLDPVEHWLAHADGHPCGSAFDNAANAIARLTRF